MRIIVYTGNKMTICELSGIYEEYFPKIYNHIYFRVLHRDLADDLVSVVFLKVAKNVGVFDESKASFKTWIYTIANNVLIDYYRSRRPEYSLDSVREPEQNFEEQSDLLASEERKALHKALEALDERTREIISLKYNAEMSIRAIAKLLDMNESTVSTLHNRGLTKLRGILSEDFFND